MSNDEIPKPLHEDRVSMQKEATLRAIENRFTYHAPKLDQLERYQKIRDTTKGLAILITELTPSSREQSLALTHLEEFSFYANASIARNE